MELCTNFNIVFGELLPHILTNSKPSDLLGHRLVSREWKKVATRILLKRGDLKIQFELATGPHTSVSPCTFYSHKDSGQSKWEECDRYATSHYRKEGFPGGRSLPSFFRMVTSSHQMSLPADHFEFRLGYHINCQPQLVSFTQVYGPKIKSLSLDNLADYFIGRKGMTNFILQYTPNLESLYMREIHIYGYVDDRERSQELVRRQNSRVVLPRLKSIEIHQDLELWCGRVGPSLTSTVKILPHLLELGPNLRRISFPSGFDPKFLEHFLSTFKTNLLNIGTLLLGERDLFFKGLDLLETLAKVMVESAQGVGLTRLRICVGAWPQTSETWKRGTAALRKILEANATSLKEIRLVAGAAAVLHKIPDLPVLPKVKTLSVTFAPHSDFVQSANPDKLLDFVNLDGSSFQGNSLPRLLPNLETLGMVCWITDDSEDDGRRWFPFWNDRFMRVKTLKAQSRHVDDIRRIVTNPYALPLKLCPEINGFATCLTFCEAEVSSLVHPLWNLTHLTSLHLKFMEEDLEGVDSTFIFLDLDAVITGLPKEVVTAIHSNWEQSGLWELPERCQVEQLRRANSSILDLQNLKKLHLEIQLCHWHKPMKFVSGVSAKFGFDLMKNLKVFIMLDYFDKSGLQAPCAHESEKREWLELHKPLTSFANVTVGLEVDLHCCEIKEIDNKPFSTILR